MAQTRDVHLGTFVPLREVSATKASPRERRLSDRTAWWFQNTALAGGALFLFLGGAYRWSYYASTPQTPEVAIGAWVFGGFCVIRLALNLRAGVPKGPSPG